MQQLQNERREYRRHELRRRDLVHDPIEQFEKWLGEARDEEPDYSAMTLSTIGLDGYPNCRTVLLKGIEQRGFMFFTNMKSTKGHELAENNKAALHFYWPALERQVIVRGDVFDVSRDDVEAYFRSRPFESQVGAVVSRQSNPVQGREEIEERFEQALDEYQHQEVSCPEDWGGYVVRPFYLEFWQGRENRLNDRFQYQFVNQKWELNRLAP